MIDQDETLIFVIFMCFNTECDCRFATACDMQSVCTSEQLSSNEEISSSNEKRLHTEWRPHGFSFQMACGHKLVLPALLLYNAQMIFSKLSEGLINPQARDRNVLLPHQKS